MPSYSVAVTSADTGPETTSQISSSTSLNRLPVLATSDGFVVTPSMMPWAAHSLISLISAVSMKNFMGAVSSSVMLRVVSRDAGAGRRKLVEFVFGLFRSIGRRGAQQLANLVDFATEKSDS